MPVWAIAGCITAPFIPWGDEGIPPVAFLFKAIGTFPGTEQHV